MSRATSFDSRSESFDRDQQNRSLVFSSIFSLPGEELVDDFTCALLKASVLLYQGRLFVSRDYICFYSALLSTEDRTIIIPFDSVVEITKKNTAWVVPNAIEIKLKDDSEFFFASFLSRNRCYDLLQSIFRKDSFSEISTKAVEPSLDSSCSQTADVTSNSSLVQHPGDCTLPDIPEKPEEPSPSIELNYELALSHFESYLSETPWGTAGLEFQEIGHAELPISTKDIFSKLYADVGSLYSAEQHFASLGASDIRFSQWRIEDKLCVRDGSLVMPIANLLSATKSTRVQETSHCCYDPITKFFHFRSQSSSLDAPYGDYFIVLLSYDFSPVDGDGQRCSVLGRVAVHFVKSAWAVKSIIISSAVEGVRKSFDSWSKAIVSVCTEGREIPLSAIQEKSYTRQSQVSASFGRDFLYFIPYDFAQSILSKYRYLVLGSVFFALIAISIACHGSDVHNYGSDLCYMIPDILSVCNNKGGAVPDLFIANIYSNAIMLKIQSLGGSVPNELDFAITKLNSILHDFIAANGKSEDMVSIVRRLKEATERLQQHQ